MVQFQDNNNKDNTMFGGGPHGNNDISDFIKLFKSSSSTTLSSPEESIIINDGIIGINFSTTIGEANNNQHNSWSNYVEKTKEKIQQQLHEKLILVEGDKSLDGLSRDVINKNVSRLLVTNNNNNNTTGTTKTERVAIKLEFENNIDLKEKESKNIQRIKTIGSSIASFLRSTKKGNNSSISEDDLKRCLMIGTSTWLCGSKSACITIDAPTNIIETLYESLLLSSKSKSNSKLLLDANENIFLTCVSPMFVLNEQILLHTNWWYKTTKTSKRQQQELPSLLLWKQQQQHLDDDDEEEDINILIPTTSNSMKKLITSGISYCEEENHISWTNLPSIYNLNHLSPDTDKSQNQNTLDRRSSISNSSSNNNNNNNNNSNIPQPPKHTYQGRLALMCCQNALQIITDKTQLALCPPGRLRRALHNALIKKNKTKKHNPEQLLLLRSTSAPTPPQLIPRPPPIAQKQQTVGSINSINNNNNESELGGYYGLDKFIGSKLWSSSGQQYSAEATGEHDSNNILRITATTSEDSYDDDDNDDDVSSGDEDYDHIDVENVFSAAINNDGGSTGTGTGTGIGNNSLSILLDDLSKKYANNLHEPLFSTTTPGSNSTDSSNPAVAGGGGGGGTTGAGESSTSNSMTSRNLPFNRRKIRFFDSISASDEMIARKYLTNETNKCKKRDNYMFTKHLRKMQCGEKVRLIENNKGDDNMEGSDSTDPKEIELELEVNSGVSQFPYPMSSSMAAALVLESLKLNPYESIEGMAVCYDGIVAAGLALLDSQLVNNNNNGGDEQKQLTTTITISEIMSGLAPLLITSLGQASGEVIVALSKLRRMCVTPRYKRRFVQRVAPCLIRPPFGAMWCLKHQNDMEAILAATELIFDSSDEIFGKGWYERGQLLLADSKRAETLNNVAEQLKNLVLAEEDDSLCLLSGLGGSHGHKRHHKLMDITNASSHVGRDSSSSLASTSESLAEWEVIAVDWQIRNSISNIMLRNWSNVKLPAGLKDTDSVVSVASSRRQRRLNASTPTGGISAGKAPSSAAASADASPKTGRHSPIANNNARPSTKGGGATLSPPSLSAQTDNVVTTTLNPESIESVFGPSFATQPPSALVTAPTLSPIGSDTSMQVPAILPPNRLPIHRRYEQEPKTTTDFTSPPQTPNSSSRGAPAPRSPVPGENILLSSAPHAINQVGSFGDDGDKVFAPPKSPTTDHRAPLSPASTPKSVDSDGLIHRRVGAVSPAGPVSSNYRVLTSTAAERKRTVAACRALRAQISRFEESFTQLHGRAPKGAAERAPLATTYAQYREWKRAIRADAACRIQALVRGACTRLKLLQSGDPQLSHIVARTCGASPYPKKAVFDQLSIPIEIENAPNRGMVGLSPMPASIGPDGIEVLIRPGQAPNVPSPASISSSGASSSFDLSNRTLPELQAQKSELKKQLKEYDMNFAKMHGRMPVKSEKEPIRYLYEQYNALKQQISLSEREAQHPGTTTTTSRRVETPPGRERRTPNYNYSRTAPSASAPASASSVADSVASISSTDEQSAPETIHSPRNAAATTAAAAAAAAAGSRQDLAKLKAEKNRLHQMLRSYEKDFFKEHKRQVSSFSDIKAVASQYRRYKEIKKTIATLQQQNRGNVDK